MRIYVHRLLWNTEVLWLFSRKKANTRKRFDPELCVYAYRYIHIENVDPCSAYSSVFSSSRVRCGKEATLLRLAVKTRTALGP